MSRNDYYEEMKENARQLRERYGLTTPKISKADVEVILRDNNIELDLWLPKGIDSLGFKVIRGAFIHDECGSTIMVSRSLPESPAIFTIVHELKHFFHDRHLGRIHCGDHNQREPIEIGAEVYAGEFLFPDADFQEALASMGIRSGQHCTPEDIVLLRHETEATLSYGGLTKKAEHLGFIGKGAFARVKWRSIEQKINGRTEYQQSYPSYRYRKKQALNDPNVVQLPLF